MDCRRLLHRAAAAGRSAPGAARGRLEEALGGAARMRVVLTLACVLGLSSADVATVGASATQLRHALGISNTDLGLLVTVTSLVSAVASLPFGVLADRVRRTRTLAVTVALWAGAMGWSAAASDFTGLLLARLTLGVVTAAAGPLVASLVGDYFPGGERGRVWGYILAGELVGAGIGFGFAGNVASLSWRAAFIVLAVPAIPLAWAAGRLREPERGAGSSAAPAYLNLLRAARYVLRVRTNLLLIIASACGYYFLAGVETFGTEFVKQQYGVGQGLATAGLLGLGAGAIAGVLTGGRAGDVLLSRGHPAGRVTVAAAAVPAAVAVAVPAILTRSIDVAVPFLFLTAYFLSAQNPPLDAARLDIMPATLWGRAESIRTLLRSLAQAVAPLAFGFAADTVFGGGRNGLQWSFLVMLAPLTVSAVLLYRARLTYPGDARAASAIAARDERT